MEIKLFNLRLQLNKIPKYTKALPDSELYTPLFNPWRGEGQFSELFQLSKPYSLVSAERCYILWLCRLCMSMESFVNLEFIKVEQPSYYQK